MNRELRAFVVGAVLLPLSALPFGVYATRTPEGRLLVDRATAAIAPPELPDLGPAERQRLDALAPRYEDGVAILVYHGIGSGASAEGSRTVSPERFGEHLAALEAAGFRPVTMQEVAQAWTGGRPLPANAVAITFDDGRTDAMLFADPLLERAGWRATMYVITGQAEEGTSPYYADWDHLVAYHRTGRWDLQSHSRDQHRRRALPGGDLPVLTSLGEGETLAAYRLRVRRDLDAAASAIEARTGAAPLTFAYPFGAHGADRTNDPALEGVLTEELRRRHALAVQQDGQDEARLATRCDDPLELRRLEVGDWTGVELVRRIAGAAGRTGPCDPPLGGD